MKVKNPTTGNWDKITLGGGVTIDNSLESDSTTHGASVHAVNVGLSGKISGDGSVEKIVKSTTAPTGTEATIWIEPSDFDSAETTILKDTLEDEDLDKAPTVHAVKQAIDNVENIDYDSLPVRSKIEYTKEHSYDNPPAGYTESSIPYTLEGIGERVDGLSDMNVYPELGKEKIIGIWYDGKPIYRKVIETSVNASGSVSTGISNMDWLVRASGTALMSSGDIFLPLNFYNSGGWDSFHVTGHGTTIQYQRGTSYEVQKTYFILEYTKTTDAGRKVTIS